MYGTFPTKAATLRRNDHIKAMEEDAASIPFLERSWFKYKWLEKTVRRVTTKAEIQRDYFWCRIDVDFMDQPCTISHSEIVLLCIYFYCI